MSAERRIPLIKVNARLSERSFKRWRFAPSFFFNDTATTEIYTLSLHDALPISRSLKGAIRALGFCWNFKKPQSLRSVSRQPVPRGARSKARGKQARRSRQRVWPAARRRGRLSDQGQNSPPTRRTRPQSFCRCLNALASACRPSAVRGLARG